MKVNLGCGTKKKEGWLNVDIDGKVKPNLKMNLNEIPYKFPSCSVDEILLDNVVEHLHLPMDKFFTEVNRILKRNGTCHIILPNFFRWKARLHYLFGGLEDCDGWELNHSILINPKVLRELLRSKGFAVPKCTTRNVLFMPEINWVIRKREDL